MREKVIRERDIGETLKKRFHTKIKDGKIFIREKRGRKMKKLKRAKTFAELEASLLGWKERRGKFVIEFDKNVAKVFVSLLNEIRGPV
ncbi:hypothetical protein IID24_03235 [Patescibacteria group bacterium]|nr:hypothetical protein [Patescibacteria group bacterium]